MVVEVESTSQLEEFRRVLRRRFWSIALPALVVTAIGVAVATVVPRKFVSSTRVMLLDIEGKGEGGTSEGRVAEHTIRSPARVRAVLSDLNWEEYTDLTRAEQVDYVERILDNLDVNTPPMDRYASQQLVEAEFAHVDRYKARDFLAQLMARWRSEVIERRQNQVRQSHAELKDARETLTRSLETIGDQIAVLRQVHNIRPGQRGPDGKGEVVAPQFGALQQAEAALLAVEEETLQQRVVLAQLEAARDRLEDEVPFVSREEGAGLDAQLAEIDAGIAKIEASILAAGWLPANSKYRAAQLQIAQLREQRDALVASRTAPLLEEVMVSNPDKLAAVDAAERARLKLDGLEAQLISESDRVAAMKIEVRELQEAIVQIDALVDEQVRTNTVLEETETRLERVRQELVQLDSPSSNPFEVQDEASLPTQATEPDPVLIVVFAVLLGLAIGLGAAISREYSGSSFRSTADVARSMSLPVLGTINTIVTRSVARKRAASRLVTGSVVGAVVVFLGFVSYAYTADRSLLTPSMERAIDQFRTMFL